MNRMRFFAATIAFLLLFSACAGISDPVIRELEPLDIDIYHNMDETLDAENSGQLAYMTHDEVLLSDEYKEKYPELDSALASFNSSLAENSRETYDQLRGMALDVVSDADISTPLPYYNITDLHIQRADEAVVSILSSVDYYTGGVHGYFYCYGTTFDTKTGRNLTLSDIVTNPKKLPKLIKSEILKNYRDIITMDEDSVDEIISDPTSLGWSLSPAGLTFYFDPYALASYADGILIAKLPESILKPEYRAECADYAEAFPNVLNLGDGNVFVDYKMEDGENFSSLGIHTGDEDYWEDISAKHVTETYIKTKDGECFLMVELIFDDGASEKRIYSIIGETKLIKKIQCGATERRADGKPVLRKHISDFKKLIGELTEVTNYVMDRTSKR